MERYEAEKRAVYEWAIRMWPMNEADWELIAAFYAKINKAKETEGKMKYSEEFAALLHEPWSNGACRGYVIYAMENCGFMPDDIRRVVSELHYVFDMFGLKEAEQHFQNSRY